MLIRYGYEISLTFPQPTALVCLLSVHGDRAADVRIPESVFTNPAVDMSTYTDLFGNTLPAAGGARGHSGSVGGLHYRG